jgi:hypothetical protein
MQLMQDRRVEARTFNDTELTTQQKRRCVTRIQQQQQHNARTV